MKKIKTNRDKLIMTGVEGKTAPAISFLNTPGPDGVPIDLPAMGGITYNVLIGDRACGWAADHVEPAVSTSHNADKPWDRQIATG